ncbi:hypothetical protein AURANDRAFT_67879 [Aureococcus anophagefferens]|uniref:IQCH-like ATP-grasp domain-containing protein n=1 Tax=Aureococcus anophagefferens TaxID=44056 RepID=F0YMQ4_AURAN|nr:hypothetical protein AURANDRAFT_67879 [Aureococcus anophagefferens]EGB03621.1 hypothetical protein AURANDRAFT_67879 [Aureococcus anophagefferens]|eukprot:XP_009041696.1 hypothetical protein AURANDRAFT_67879 [Aureococcus anophagefferens]
MDHVDGGEDIFKPSSSTTKHRDRSKAATLIQTVARRVVARKRFLSHRVRRDAAVSIQSQARRKLAVATVLDGIARLRSERATHWDALSARLRRDAAHLAPGAERVEIHVPSLGHSEHVRLDAPRFQLSQAMQIARLCAAADPNTHVVYVSPVELGDELVDYYQRVLSLARGGSGDDDDDADGDPASTPRPGASSRFTVIVPELVRRFPAHFTLASLALYSPSCCRRLYHLSAGRFAVIVPGGPVGWAEKALALRLDVPLLGPDPSRAALYGSRSGAKRVLHESDVNIPVGAHDIYDEEDFCVALAKLVAGHLDVARWKFGVDADARADAGASGVAYLDVDDLDVVRDLRHEQRRLTALDRHKGEAAWHHPDVQVLARSKLLRSLRVALAARAVVCYPGKRPEGGAWPSFMALVQRYGGVIEAEPRDVVGHSCVHAFVRPDGVVSVRAAQDVLSTDGYERIVAVHPAAAAPVEALAGATAAVARRLFDRGVPRGVVGHFTLHFTAHRSADAGGALRLWATDLELGLNPLAVGHLLHVAVTGRAPRKPAPGAGPAPPADPAKRSYVLVPGFYHPGLAALKYSSFFKLCRLHGIAFDLAKRRGPVLLLVDSLASGVVGAVTEGANKLDALRLCHKFLTFVRKHVDTAHLIHHVAGPADRELPDLIHVVNGALRPLEHMISSLAIGPELAAPLIHDRRRLPQPDDAATPAPAPVRTTRYEMVRVPRPRVASPAGDVAARSVSSTARSGTGSVKDRPAPFRNPRSVDADRAVLRDADRFAPGGGWWNSNARPFQRHAVPGTSRRSPRVSGAIQLEFRSASAGAQSRTTNGAMRARSRAAVAAAAPPAARSRPSSTASAPTAPLGSRSTSRSGAPPSDGPPDQSGAFVTSASKSSS